MDSESACIEDGINDIKSDIDDIEVEPIFSYRKNKDIVQIRAYIKYNLWKIFKVLMQLRSIDKSTALNQAIRLYIDSDNDSKHLCINCENKIDENNFLINIKEGEYFYYCSDKCYSKFR